MTFPPTYIRLFPHIKEWLFIIYFLNSVCPSSLDFAASAAAAAAAASFESRRRRQQHFPPLSLYFFIAPHFPPSLSPHGSSDFRGKGIDGETAEKRGGALLSTLFSLSHLIGARICLLMRTERGEGEGEGGRGGPLGEERGHPPPRWAEFPSDVPQIIDKNYIGCKKANEFN